MTAVVFGLASAIFYALGLVIQQHVVATAPVYDQLSPRLLVEMVRHPAWVLGILTMGVGQICEGAALDRGSLSLVEPLMASSLLFALVMATIWTGQRLGAREVAGALVLLAGLTAFIVAAGSDADRFQRVARVDWLVTCVAITLVVGALLLVSRRTGLRDGAVLVGAGSGILYGLQDALTQRTLLISGHHGVGDLVTHWQPYALVIVGLAGLSLNQSAFAMAPLNASLPSLTAAEPVTGIAIGVGLLGERIRLAWPYAEIEAVSLALVVVGIVLVARSPLVAGPDPAVNGAAVASSDPGGVTHDRT